jgi:hypothetical protein
VKENYAKQYHFGLHRMQAEELYNDKKQAHDAKPPGNEKILQVLPWTQTAQGDKVAETGTGQ